MTKIEACNLLGVSRSAGKAKAKQAFSERHRELTRRLRPGNLPAVRQKTQADIAMLMTARDTFCQLPSSPRPYPQKSHQRKTQKPKPRKAKPAAAAVINYPKPQTLADAWELFVQLSPFHEHVTMILLALTFLIVLIGLLANC